jgi:DNA replication and repair protein RecF
VFESRGQTHDLRIQLFPHKRRVSLDGKSLRAWESYSAALVAILFCPEDTYLFRSPPQARRAALDRMLFHRDKRYAGILSRYDKALRQKNALLRDECGDRSTLPAWNEALVTYGSEIAFRRARYLSDILPLIEATYAAFAQGGAARQQVELQSRCLLGRISGLETEIECETPESVQDEFRAQLEAKARAEALARVSLVGPHRDDWWLLLDGKAVASTASQGEHRSLVIALKLAEIELLKKELEEAPLFLLDDVASELDTHRRAFLMERLAATGCQTFITSTESAPFLPVLPPDSRIFEL